MPTADDRYCRICEERMAAPLCPTHGVHTVAFATVRPKASQLEPGTIIAERYRIEGRIGRGAMGSVYAATQMAVDRRVALKILPPELSRDGAELRRFHREARNASRLMHPHVVRVHEFGLDESTGLSFIAMEHLEGRTLRRIIAEEAPLAPTRVGRLLEQVSRALLAAHEAGIVHRDLKPDNIIVTVLSEDDEHVTVVDFGIAKSMPAQGEVLEQLTESGMVVGTPGYMSPEQVRGVGIGPHSDLYALGCILHELLTGRRPFSAEDSVSLMLKHVNAIPPVLPWIDADPATSNALRILHGLLLCKRPEGRPASAARVARVLRKIGQGRPPVDPLAILMGAPLGVDSTVSSDGLRQPDDELGSGDDIEPTSRRNAPPPEPTPRSLERPERSPGDAVEPISLARAAMLPLAVLLGSIAIAIAIWVTFGGSSGEASSAARQAQSGPQRGVDEGR